MSDQRLADAAKMCEMHESCPLCPFFGNYDCFPWLFQREHPKLFKQIGSAYDQVDDCDEEEKEC